MKKRDEEQAEQTRTDMRTNLEQTAANMKHHQDESLMELEEKLKHHQDAAVMELKEKLKDHQNEALFWKIYPRQILVTIRITSALKLRFGDAHLTELLHGQLHNRTQQAPEDLTTFVYEVQSLAKRAFVNSPIETQEYVAARQFVEGIADLGIQRIVRLSSPRTLQDALVKALDIEAATKATRMTRRVRYVVEDNGIEVRPTSFTPRGNRYLPKKPISSYSARRN
nr:unnamed protein product [Callosobruchus chinensis]